MLQRIDMSPQGDASRSALFDREELGSPRLRVVRDETPAVDHVAFSFIKSGYEDCYEPIMSDFGEYGLYPVHTQEVTLASEIVDYIYRDSVREHFYVAMKRHITQTSVVAMIIEGHGAQTQESVSSFKKGENGFPNLREKYARKLWLPDEDVELWQQGLHPKQDEVSVLLTQKNVLHCADTPEEAAESIKMVFGPEMLEALAKGYTHEAHVPNETQETIQVKTLDPSIWKRVTGAAAVRFSV